MAGAIPQSAPVPGPPPLVAAPLPRIHRGWRVFIFYSCALLLTGLVSMLFADLLWRTGWSASRTVLFILFVILFLLIAVGSMHGVFGFVLRAIGNPRRITQTDYRAQSIDGTSTAVVFPIYNEDIVRVYEGLRATYESLAKNRPTGTLRFFHSQRFHRSRQMGGGGTALVRIGP